jgi:excisionase family DNA binding protein
LDGAAHAKEEIAMSKAIDRFIEAQEGERKARRRLEEIVSQFLKVAEGVKNWQNVAFEWWHNDAAHPLGRSDHPAQDIIRTTDIPTISDVQAAVEEANIAAKILEAATADLTKEERQALCRTDDTNKAPESTLGGKGDRSGYVTTNQAANHLGVTRQRMLVMLHQGRLPFEVLNGRYMIKLDDLEKFAAVERPAGRPFKNIF